MLGEGLGVQRQREDCEKVARDRGWRVYDCYVDNDVSAFSGKRRPDYERLLEDVAARRINGIIAWHTDRLHRSPKELEAFIDLVESTGCTVDTVQAGPVDLSTPSGRVMARTLGAFARYESEHKSERIRRKLEQNAAAGRIHGGRRPYGWDDDRVTIRECEAAVIRTAAERILAGASMKSLCRDLNAAGATNTEGNPWQHATLRAVMMRPRNAGLRRHRGTIIGQGEWQPILDVQVWDDVRRVLTDPRRRTTPGAAGRTRLLSGIAICDVCGGIMRSAKGKAYKGKWRWIYRCKSASCVTRDLERLDDYITRLVCARLAREDAADLLVPESEAGPDPRVEIERLRQRLDDAASDYADDLITADQLRTITARLREQMANVEVRATPPTHLRPLAAVVQADDVETAWKSLDVRQQRDLIGTLVDIRVRPTMCGRKTFDYDAVAVTWK